MATYTIFGTGAQTGFSGSAGDYQIALSTAFYVTVSGWNLKAIRVWLPSGINVSAGGHKAYLWTDSGTVGTPDTALGNVNFGALTAGAWNEAIFVPSITLTANKFYWAQVHFPLQGSGDNFGFKTAIFGSVDPPLVSVDTASLLAASRTQVLPGQASFVNGAAGAAPSGNGAGVWYGVDVLVDDSGIGGGLVASAGDSVGLDDSVLAVRSGLPDFVHATASATDPLGLATAATANLLVGGGPSAIRTVRRALFDYRVAWGAVTNTVIQGPTYVSGGPVTVGLEFHVVWPVRFVGCRVYKNPSASGSVPVRLWDHQGTAGAERELGNTTLTWVSDQGGWRDVVFPTPIDLIPGVDYILSCYSPTGYHVISNYVFFWWNDIVTPLEVTSWSEPGGQKIHGSARHFGTEQIAPADHVPDNYYLEPIVEWESNDPVFVPDPGYSYYQQWTNGVPTKPFMIGVYFADPPFLAEYAAMGVNTLIAGSGTSDYVAAIKATGMDHYPFVSLDPAFTTIRSVQEDPAYAAHVRGYQILDEPDQFFPYTPPSTLRQWCRDARLLDSTRPLMIGMGRVVGINQTFTQQPQGSNMDEANVLWRDWAQLSDILMGDFYTLTPDQDTSSRWGVWTYSPFTRRLRQLNEGRTPIWLTVETTSQRPDEELTPAEVVQACWACLIAGANGLIFYDHRFANELVAQDFAHMLHNPPMKAAVSAMITRIMTLTDALHCLDLGLVTATTSSNTTSGPRGGTYGVPLHYTTREDDTHEYLFAMGIRPGSTTATFTIPSWAGETVTVLDESRTVTVDGAGVLTDNFPADYTVHLYQRDTGSVITSDGTLDFSDTAESGLLTVLQE